MTSWDLSSLLLVMLLNIDLSEQACLDYLNQEQMGETPLLHLVPLVKAKNDNSTSTIICTLKNECQKNKSSRVCNLLEDCIYLGHDDHDSSDTSECEVASRLNISLYHLTCLTAEIFFSIIKAEHTYEGCKYDNVCQLYSDITSHASLWTSVTTAQTTTRPPSSTASERAPTAPSALSPETTAPGTLMQKATTTAPCTPLPKATPTAPRTLLPKATPTAPRTLSPKTTPTAPRTPLPKTTPAAPRTPLPKTTPAAPRTLSAKVTPTAPTTEQKTRTTTAPTALFLTTTATTTTLLRKGDKAPTTGMRIGESNVFSLLLMSLTFNVVGPLLVYLYMRWRTQNQTPVDGPWEEVAHTVTHLEFQNMHSGTGPETVQLMQLTESASDITSRADPAQDGFTERMPG